VRFRCGNLVQRAADRLQPDTALAAAAAARDRSNAPRRPAAARQPLRIAAGAQLRPLGEAELVAEVKFLTWTDDNLLRQVVYEGLREDKPAREVWREVSPPEPVSDDAIDRSANFPQRLFRRKIRSFIAKETGCRSDQGTDQGIIAEALKTNFCPGLFQGLAGGIC
jgi:hypothetical protein